MKHQSDSEVLLYQTDDGTTRVEVRKYECLYMMISLFTNKVCLP